MSFSRERYLFKCSVFKLIFFSSNGGPKCITDPLTCKKKCSNKKFATLKTKPKTKKEKHLSAAHMLFVWSFAFEDNHDSCAIVFATTFFNSFLYKTPTDCVYRQPILQNSRALSYTNISLPFTSVHIVLHNSSHGSSTKL